MRQSSSVVTLALALLALGCEGTFIPELPTTPNSPPPSPPVLALRVGDVGPELLADMTADLAGNVYLAGTFTGTADFDPGAGITALTSLGETDVFLAKYSSSGGLVWVVRIGGTSTERVTSLARDAAGNLYVGGAFQGSTDFDPSTGIQVLTSVGGEDGFVAKLSSLGELVWSRRFGGVGADQVTGVAADAAGQVFATGTFTGSANPVPAIGPTLSANSSGQDAFLMGFDVAGAISFALPVGGPEADLSSAIALTAGGVVVIGGIFRGGANFLPGSATTQLTSIGGGDAFLAGYSGAGVFLWARALGGLGEEEIRAGGLASDNAGGVVATGTFTGTTDFDGGPLIANRTSLGATDWFAVRYDGGGSFLSAFSVGSVPADPAPRPSVDLDGTVLVTGGFSGPVDFDPGSASEVVASLGSGGATDVFAAKYTFGGGLVWVSRFGEGTALAERQNRGIAIVPFPAGGILVSGQFFGSPDFDPGTNVFRLTSLGGADAFAVLLTSTGALTLTP